jgi:hypothetical protein
VSSAGANAVKVPELRKRLTFVEVKAVLNTSKSHVRHYNFTTMAQYPEAKEHSKSNVGSRKVEQIEPA